MAHAESRFPYVLVDNCFRIQVKGAAAKLLPLAYVQISSEYLAAVGVEEAELGLRFCIESLGAVEGEAMVARVDLFVDFITPLDFDAVSVRDWITRAEDKAKYYQRDRFSGWTVGKGGNISARLYDKTLEIQKSKKYWLHELWLASGWNGEEKVWRMEFQIKREALKEWGIRTVPELVAKRHNLWQYLCEDYLRLAQPSETDQTRSRWPNHPLWDALAASFLVDGLSSGKLARFSSTRAPSDEHLFLNGLGALSSFMAREGITDLGEAIGEYFNQAEAFHRGKDKSGMRGYQRNGLEFRTKEFLRITKAAGEWEYPGNLVPVTREGAFDYYFLKSGRQRVTLFVGDSNIEQYFPRVEALVASDPKNTNGIIFKTGGGCLAVPDQPHDVEHKHCSVLMKNALRIAKENPQVDTVVIGSLWNQYLRDGAAMTKKYGIGSAEYVDALDKLSSYIKELQALNKRVFLVLNIPMGGVLDPKFMAKRDLKAFPKVLSIRSGGVPRVELEIAYGQIQADLAQTAKSAGATVISPIDSLCEANCSGVDAEGEPMYKDAGHLRPTYVRRKADFIDVTVQ